MNAIHFPGLAGEIAQHLNEQAPVATPRMAMGGAIALLGAIVGAGWELPHIGLYPGSAVRRVLPHLEPEDFPTTQPIGQSVMLVADPAHGKGGIIEGVEQLLGGLLRQRPDTSAIAQRLLTIQHFNHLALAGMEPEPEDVDRVRGIVKPATFDRLLDGSLFLLAESTPDDFDYLLPHWYEGSPFYGQCLMIRHHGPKGEKNRQPHGQPSALLLGRLAELADLAQAGRKVLVEVTEDAAAWYRLFLRLDMDTYSEHGPVGLEGEWARQSLQGAAIVAVGLNPLRPVITAELFRLASDLASEGVRLARAGLGVAGV
ncbi:hypothetical protein [Pseudomonas aeruginosa]|uniref:hypothetical protein n=1 Tax=Pseudomonas aeruginosa TaxID=287 RepID=UPI001CD7A749|nr:hypothetical protein [Pseudomonas aeruginosa]